MHRRIVLLSLALLSFSAANLFAADTPSVIIRPAEPYRLPGVWHDDIPQGGAVDCNSPAHWNGQTLHVFSSTGSPSRTSGTSLMNLARKAIPCSYDNVVNGRRWIEATWKDPSGKLYGWYHREPAGVCPGRNLTAPLIGAVVSDDDGLHWRDLGVVLEAPKDSNNCDTVNNFFVGGNGDCSVILDRSGRHFYFFISTYNKDIAEQGVAIARMKFENRDNPVGKVEKWHDGKWAEPGLGGHVSPIWPAMADWHQEKVDAFWGAAIHYNTHLDQYVILLNRAQDKNFGQEGIYISFNRDLTNPLGWSKPLKILNAKELENSKWYPQIIGTDVKAHETDKLAGKTARLFVAGLSKWEIEFHRAGE